jgi:hypothetical protein
MFALAFVGALGLVVDLGRLYLLKSQAQARADSAALTAAARLDRTHRGLADSAQVAVRAAGQPGQAEVAFSTAAAGPWSGQKDAAVESRFVRVRLRLETPVFFSRLLTGDSRGVVGATAAAGQVQRSASKAGEFPCDAVDVAERIRQDTDRDSRTYEEYEAGGKGNGRRIVACSGGSGIGGFFVNDESGARESIGAYVEGSRRRGAASQPGFYLVRLVE